MKTKALLCALVLTTGTLFAQKYITKDGVIHIFSETSLFTIEAENIKVASILNIETGELVASTLVRSFKFKEALVEEHFNENYLEAHKFPKSQLKGKITNIKDINFTKDGEYKAVVEGDLTIHGATNAIKENATITVKNGKITGTAKIVVSLKKYAVAVEDSYKDRIKDEIELTIKFNYEAMK